MILLKTHFFNLICGGMIGNSNYIGTCLNGLIRNQHPKELNPFQFLQKSYINNNDRTARFFCHSKLTPLDIVDFYNKKHMNEIMETEMKEMDEKLGKTLSRKMIILMKQSQSKLEKKEQQKHTKRK